MRLRDRVAIITGAARGLGREACVAFAREGAKVVATDVLSCAETARDVELAGGECFEVTTDVSSAAGTDVLVAKTVERFGRLDVLVNNAAVLPRVGPFDEITEREWEQVMSVNVKGMWLVSKAAVRVMRAQARGRIVNLSSNTVWAGVPFMLHYVTSKGAIVAFTRALARELGNTGINVNAVAPGFTSTPGTLAIAEAPTLERIQARAVGQRAIQRHQEPSDCMGALVFLASDDSAFVTGQILTVDGGAT